MNIKWLGINLNLTLYTDTYIEEGEEIVNIEEAFTTSGDDILPFLNEAAYSELMDYVIKQRGEV